MILSVQRQIHDAVSDAIRTHFAVAEAFAARDPYVLNGLVTKWRVRPWNVVTVPGGLAGKQA